MYGMRGVVSGLKTCKQFRATIPAHMRRWAPAGMFNCGTNTLLKLMRLNCRFDGVGRHVLWQAPWGKHNPVSWRGEHWAPQFRRPSWQPRLATVFPTMLVKDPLTWMKSMCRNTYEADFKHHHAHRGEACPSPVDHTRTVVRFQPTRLGKYASLAHLWAEWNSAYVANDTFPRLIVRFEDLLFDTEATVRTVCECVGGTMRSPFRQAEDAAKTVRDGHRGPVNDRERALRLYGSEAERYAHYTEADLAFVRQTLEPSGLLDTFHYGFFAHQPPNNTRRRSQ